MLVDVEAIVEEPDRERIETAPTQGTPAESCVIGDAGDSEGFMADTEAGDAAAAADLRDGLEAGDQPTVEVCLCKGLQSPHAGASSSSIPVCRFFCVVCTTRNPFAQPVRAGLGHRSTQTS